MAKKSAKRNGNNPPEKVFRIGFITASVFGHEIETDEGPITVRSVNVQKRYKDGDDVKYTSSFNLAELPQAVRVLQMAQGYVERAEAEIILN
ncbi:hypothetical protein [Gimesia panareensis]|uniref:hypothetical protein n=1 Tax=Gimesia panareensis TaxID=2527978 RepID=UPI001187AB52|nr:hypothetical protein [Gimesia panareensis]QDU52989.1 hypothetical protein Pan110_53710 [Gimesia panareensis]